MKTIQTEVTERNNAYSRPDEAWLDLCQEDVYEPDLPVVDAHHHVWDRKGNRYLFDEFSADLGCGHDIRATVHLECGAMYRADGPREMKPVGETEFINGIAAMFASGKYGSTQACAGMIGFADLYLGERVKDVLEAHIAAGGGRFRGVRNISAWYPDEAFVKTITYYRAPEKMLLDPDYQAGFAQLAPLDLSFETYLFHTQLGDIYELAKKFDETKIVLDFFGGPLKIGPFLGHDDEVFTDWRAGIKRLADCPNVYLKLGGLTLHTTGAHYRDQPRPPSSDQIAAPWFPYVNESIEAFGVDRCLFGTNFPADKPNCSARVCWNAMKKLAHGLTADEKRAVFSGTASRLYRLGALT